MISNIENAEVKVANKNNNKKISKKNAPNGILLNTAGSTTNKSPGPSVGSKPKEKTAGKIANPAKREMIIFIVTIVKADLVRSSFLDKEELYVTITETPTLIEKNECTKAKKKVRE